MPKTVPLTMIVVVIIGCTPMIVATQSPIWTGQQKRQLESHKSLRGRDGCNAQIGDRFLECRIQIKCTVWHIGAMAAYQSLRAACCLRQAGLTSAL